jgi:hypothetical protein
VALHAANALNAAFGDDDGSAEDSESSDDEPLVVLKRPAPVKRKAESVPEVPLAKIAKTDVVCFDCRVFLIPSPVGWRSTSTHPAQLSGCP